MSWEIANCHLVEHPTYVHNTYPATGHQVTFIRLPVRNIRGIFHMYGNITTTNDTVTVAWIVVSKCRILCLPVPEYKLCMFDFDERRPEIDGRWTAVFSVLQIWCKYNRIYRNIIFASVAVTICCRRMPSVMTPLTLSTTQRWTEQPLRFRRATRDTRLANSSAKSRRSSRQSVHARCLKRSKTVGCWWPTHTVRPSVCPPFALKSVGRAGYFSSWSVGHLLMHDTGQQRVSCLNVCK